MLVKNSNILIATNLLRTINTTKCSIKLAFKVQAIIDNVNVLIKTIETLKADITENFVERDENGEKKFADPEKKYYTLTAEGTQRLNELMNLESSLSVDVFTLDELDSLGITITPAELSYIRWLIK